MQKFIVGSYMVIGLVLFSGQGFSQSASISSPDGRITAAVSGGSGDSLLHFTITQGPAVLLTRGMLALEGIPALHYPATVKKMPQVKTVWQTVYGERKNITDHYNSQQWRFTAKEDTSFRVIVDIRLYNGGFAFRYLLQQKGRELLLKDERTAFELPEGASGWVSNTAQGPITEKKINEIKDEAERPLTVKAGKQHWLALGEAGLVDFARMKFIAAGNNGLVTRLYGAVSGKEQLQSPWRYVQVAASPARLLEQNYFVLNLNEPCRLAQTGWIKPGKVLREATLTTRGSYASIDFAAAHGIRYICFDAGWYGREDHDSSDATRVMPDPLRSKGPLDLQKVIQYGKSKNVGVILYVNRRALERQLDTLLPLYSKWGVSGIKFGFVQVGSQQWTSWLHAAIRKAAKYHLLVDIHDEYRPTGYTRTYPNLLTQEGIRGDEESPLTEQTIKTLFTRMLAGPADNTNCYFTKRVDKMGSHAAQLAKSVCIYSPLNFLYWYDRPATDSLQQFSEGIIQEVPELEWFNTLPVVWDETRVLEADMEAYATIARKKDGRWWLGSLNGTAARTVALPLNFLDRQRVYRATLFQDDPAAGTATRVKISTRQVTSASVLSLPVGAGNGFAIRIAPL